MHPWRPLGSDTVLASPPTRSPGSATALEQDGSGFRNRFQIGAPTANVTFVLLYLERSQFYHNVMVKAVAAESFFKDMN